MIEVGSFWEYREGIRRSSMTDKVIRVADVLEGTVFYDYPRFGRGTGQALPLVGFEKIFKQMNKNEVIKWKLKR